MAYVCVDASVALNFLFNASDASPAAALWAEWLRRRDELVAPPLFRAEVTSVIRERVYRREITAPEGALALQQSLSWPIEIWTDSDVLQPVAFELASRFNRPKAYDAQYLAVAELIGCDLWTADRRLYNSVKGRLEWVRLIEEGA